MLLLSSANWRAVLILTKLPFFTSVTLHFSRNSVSVSSDLWMSIQFRIFSGYYSVRKSIKRYVLWIFNIAKNMHVCMAGFLKDATVVHAWKLNKQTPPITLVIIHFQVFLFSISIFLNPDFKYDFLVRVRNKWRAVGCESNEIFFIW